mmetsp:Transcript_35995/g.106436  ORF Transcript_35995/g.106436 Transcript_35995/m.106436 type:complete len:213 (+) Transcript_35995:558-1196(+)
MCSQPCAARKRLCRRFVFWTAWRTPCTCSSQPRLGAAAKLLTERRHRSWRYIKDAQRFLLDPCGGPCRQRVCHQPSGTTLSRRATSHRHAVVLAPFLHDARDHLDLWVAHAVVIGQHRDDLAQSLLVALLASDDGLEGPDTRALLALQVLWCRVEALEHIERLGGKVKVAHAVAVVRDELEQLIALVACLQAEVELPGQVGLSIHDVAPCQP